MIREGVKYEGVVIGVLGGAGEVGFDESGV